MVSNSLSTPQTSSRNDHLLFMFVTLLYWIPLYTYVPLLAPYLDSLGASFSFAGIVLGSYGLMQLIIRLPLGIASDRLQLRKPFLIFGLSTGALSCLMFLLPGLGWALAARIISGVSASSWVAFTVIYASYFPKNRTAQAMGQISLLMVMGKLIGMGLSGLLAGLWNWTGMFWGGAAAGTLGLLLAIRIKEPNQDMERKPVRPQDIREVLKFPALWKVSILSILAHAVLFITMYGFTPSQAIALGASKAQLSFLVFAFMIPHGFASFIAGKWLEPRIGNWMTLIIGFFGSSICTLCIPLMSSFNGLVSTQILGGFFQGLCFPLLLAMAIEPFDSRLRATAMGFYQAIYAAGMFAGPFAAGWINDSFGLSGGFYTGAGVALFAAGLSALWAVSRKQQGQQASSSSVSPN